LHALRPGLVIGFEMFPRRLQPALDRWVAGSFSESEFLAATDWRNTWGFDAQLYLPLFHFARMNRIPMAALNVEKDLPRAVREQGFDAVEPARREGVTRPAAPSQAYLDFLYPVFAEHERERFPDKKLDKKSAEFGRFVESQAVWDRAMAQGIAEALAARPGALVIGVMGRHHAAHGYGVPHQLADLGVRDSAVLLPWDRDADCAELVAGLADAVFGVAAAASADAARRPRLGVRLEAAEGGVRIRAVDKDSIAEAAGLRAGDLVIEIAGRPAKQTGDVADVVARQAPGTWLPMRVKRADVAVDLIAKFPPLAN
jgi:Haem-binding uptake, Tiki superfamily, ChaN/PDZ domain